MSKVIATFSYRHDKHLVPGLLRNISWVDDYIAHDDTKNTGIWFNEREVRLELRQRAIDAGADWILEIDPDERFERRAGDVFRALTQYKYKAIFQFNLKELYLRDEYRVDGIWDRKKRLSLYPVFMGQEHKDKEVHFHSFPINKDYQIIPLDINLYHLKMIDSNERVKRMEIFKKLDPDNKLQNMGYDYLADETNMVLEKIPKGRGYLLK